MKINEVLKTLERYAPLELSDKLVKQIGGFDNVGIIAQVEGDITGIVFTLDLTDESIDRALDMGANLIVTHHPAIYNPLLRLDYLKSPILRCVNEKIGVISMHLNLDCAEKGIDYYLAKGLGATEQEIIYKVDNNCGYGRIFKTSTTLLELKEKYEKEFLTQKVMIFGDPNREIEKVASYCGSGLDDTAIETITDVDLYVSADIKHHLILAALKRGKCVMQVTHYSSEMYGFREFYKAVKEKFSGIKTDIIESSYML